MKTYAETVNAARDLACNNGNIWYVFNNKGWGTTQDKDYATVFGDYTKCFPNGKTEKVVAK